MRHVPAAMLAAVSLLLLVAPVAVGQHGEPADVGLLGTAWDDPTPFLQGLIASEQTPSAGRLTDGTTIYQVRMAIDETLSRVAAEMEIAYTNREEEPLHELVLRAFPPVVGGSLQISDARIDGEPVATAVDPVAGRLTVPLPSPLPPGQRTVLRLDTAMRIPTAPAAHYGLLEASGDAVSLAHALPIVAVYDRSGWHAEEPAPFGDVTYSDAAFFLVEVSAPSRMQLIASGVELTREIGTSTQTRSFAVGPAREFYVTATSGLEQLTEVVGEVTVNSYAPPAQLASSQEALSAAIAAVQIYSALYGAYPYTELDIVASPMRAGGMEFPGLVLIGLAEYGRPLRPSEEPVDFFELIVAHEVGHQWFYNLVGSDQIREPWLDESLTQYATWRYFESRYGADGALGFAAWVAGRLLTLPTPAPPIGMPVWAYSEGAYGAAIYALGVKFLQAVEEQLGRETLADALHTYVTDLRWSLASTTDIRGHLESRCGCDLTALFAQWVYAN